MVDDKSLKEEFESIVEREFGKGGKATQKEKQRMTLESRHYTEFKREIMPEHLSWYEKGCNIAEKILKISPTAGKTKPLQTAIDTCHLNVTPIGATSFVVVFPLLIALVGAFLGFVLPYLFTGQFYFFFVFFFFALGAILMLVFQRLPFDFARAWRMKASNQMVLCIFYIVTYMRHTSNLENAIDFASNHLTGPLALDMKKVLWDVETEKFQSVQESLDFYLENWRDFAMEFVEAFHLVQSSLLEPLEARRLEMLDKSLDVILEETYEKMLHYAHNLHGPMTMLHMLGIIMPILGLVILPLVVSIIGGVKWYYIATIYNIILPLGVFYLGKQILATRPTGFGDTSITEDNPEIKKFRKTHFSFGSISFSMNPIYLSIIIMLVFFVIGSIPVFAFQLTAATPEGVVGDICFTEKLHRFNPALYTVDPPPLALFCFLGYRKSLETGQFIGPFGLISTLLSIMIIIGFGIGIGFYYKMKSKNVIKIRQEAKKLENEFATGLFQLGNRMGDGLPAEVAFGRVAVQLENTRSGKFFAQVSQNITQAGMNLQEAIFDEKAGAILRYPSAIINSSMKMMVESVKKGPQVAARSLMNISRYIKEIHRVNERLKDLMADIISNMASQIKFLTPAISGVVVGITSMITLILGKLDLAQSTGGLGGAENIGNILGGEGIPTYYFQIIVGIYIVQLIYILTVLGNNIENGVDKFSEEYRLGKNLTRSTVIYSLIMVTAVLGFSLLASVIINRSLV